METKIPCVLMRGGTSRGPFFLDTWLPSSPRERDRLLLAVMGSPHALQVDGIGGGNTLTSKVAIVSRSEHEGCDVDYLFAQVSVDKALVDTRPNCGNMLSGVAPFAIEQGLVPARSGETKVRIWNVNTGSVIEATVQTPEGRVTYEGQARIDGVQAPAAPIRLNFLSAWGAVTGSLFPTGQRLDRIEGIEVTCIDAAMPMVLMAAESLGLRGDESAAQLDANGAMLQTMERVRRQAGLLMGLGDVADSVIPKPVLLSRSDAADCIRSRYFTPHSCHQAHAATGAVGVATAVVLPGTVAHALGNHGMDGARRRIGIEHPGGRIDVDLDMDPASGAVVSAGLIRTARKILSGEIHVADDAAPA